MAEDLTHTNDNAVKAIGDGWTLDVLGVPFGGPNSGKDAHGEYFSARTKTHHNRYPTPQAMYYHGYTPDGAPQGEPVEVGEARYSHSDAKGHWYRVVLDKAVDYARRIRDSAVKGMARASSGTIGHLKRVAADGEILNWPVVELSIFDTDGKRQPANSYAVAMPALKARLQRAGIDLPDFPDSETTPETDATGATSPVAVVRTAAVTYPPTMKTGVTTMTPEELQAAAEAQIAAEREEKEKNDKAAQEAYTNAYRAGAAKAEAAAAEKIAAIKAEAVAAGRLPVGGEVAEGVPMPVYGQAPYQGKFQDTNKADTMSLEDTAFTVGVLLEAKRKDPQHPGASAGLLRALAIKMAEDGSKLGNESRSTLKAAGFDPGKLLSGSIKADEINRSTLASYGDEWVGVEYSRRLWEAVRYGTFVLAKMPQVEVPQGAESIIVPLESGDPTWYKVAQAADQNATTLRPDATVPSSRLGTNRGTLSVAKMGARVQFTGELIEDSLIPWAAQLRRQLEVSGAEVLEHVIIDGDTDATNSTNINDIDGTPGATEVFLLLNGFRKSALVTTTANSRSAGGSLADTDFLNTIKLMGTGGLNALDKSKVEFIIDINTHWKALELASVKTRDVFTGATIENGVLTGIWGYPVRVSAQMHRESAKRMAETTGKIDQTDGDNTTGAILAVRYDQWLFGYKRRMQIKLQEIVDADVTQIVALARVGLLQRDTEGAAISYNVGV